MKRALAVVEIPITFQAWRIRILDGEEAGSCFFVQRSVLPANAQPGDRIQVIYHPDDQFARVAS